MSVDAAYDVAIVGFGPVGAIAACWLGQVGIKTLVIDKSRTIWEIPRAMALDHEILRVFQNIGVIDQVLPYTAPFGASVHYGAKGQPIRSIGVVPPPYPLGYLPNMVFTQPPVEKILRDRAEAHAFVTVELGKEAIGLEQSGNYALLTVRDEAGNSETVSAAYVVGCDGATSTIRRLMKISLDDLGFDEPWLVVDLLLHEQALAKLPVNCAQYCEPERPYTYIIGPGNHRRWEIMLNSDEDPRRMENEAEVWRLLSRWVAPTDGRLWRASSYRFHALVAHSWRDGRIFLAGDAAHQQPPFIGQGMCQGVRDVTNLCWKLIAVLQGKAGDRLLDTYEPERSEHVRTLTQRIKQIGAAICERDPEAARLRDETLLKQGGGRAVVVTRQEIVPPIASGLIAPEHGPGAGTLFPQPRLAPTAGPALPSLMDDLAGAGWHLFWDGRAGPAPSKLGSYGIHAFALGGEHCADLDGVAGAWFDRYASVAAIVRPDHYVYCGLRDWNAAAAICSELQGRIAAAGTASAG